MYINTSHLKFIFKTGYCMDILTLIKPTNVQKGTTSKTVWGQGTDTWCVPWGNQAGNRENNVGGPWITLPETKPASLTLLRLKLDAWKMKSLVFLGFWALAASFSGKTKSCRLRFIPDEFQDHLSRILKSSSDHPDTLPETNSSHLKMDVLELLGPLGLFSGGFGC